MAMNKILAKVENIKENKALHQINFSSNLGNLSLVSLEVVLKLGDEIMLGFKPTAVAVAKSGNELLSYSNQFEVMINSLEKGEILTKITAFKNDEKLTSIITTDSANRLNLGVGDRVVFLVKATDVFIADT